MKNFIFSIAILFILGILVTSCQDEFADSETQEHSLFEQSQKKGRTLTRLDVAKTFNHLIKSKTTNELLVSSIGNDEFPLFKLQNESRGKSTLGELLNNTNSPTDRILEADPLLNLFIYYPNDEKDFGKPITKIAVVNDRKGKTEVLLLDKIGNTTEMQDDGELGEVTLVLKSNESMIALNPRNITDTYGSDYSGIKEMLGYISPIYKTSKHEVFSKTDIETLENVKSKNPTNTGAYKTYEEYCHNGRRDPWEEGIDCGGPFCPPCADSSTCDDGVQNGLETGIDCGGPDCEPCSVMCDRDRNPSRDYLHRFRLADCASYKGIKDFLIEGKHYEFRIDVIFADPKGNVSNVLKTKTIHKSDLIKTKWGSCSSTKWYDFDPDVDIVTWTPEAYGDRMKYIWSEEDGGAQIKVNFGIKTTFKFPGVAAFTVDRKIDLRFQDKDDQLGEAVVEYCDNTDGQGYDYNTADLTFYVRQH